MCTSHPLPLHSTGPCQPVFCIWSNNPWNTPGIVSSCPAEPSQPVCDPSSPSLTPALHSLPELSFQFCVRVYGSISDTWDLPRPAWLIPGCSEKIPQLSWPELWHLTITGLPCAAILQLQSQVMSHTELLPQTERAFLENWALWRWVVVMPWDCKNPTALSQT